MLFFAAEICFSSSDEVVGGGEGNPQHRFVNFIILTIRSYKLTKGQTLS